MAVNSKAAGSKTFVRSLNLLLKSARLYGIEHVRCADQLRTVWSDLQGLIGESADGAVLGVAGKQLLVDGQPIETGHTERSFVDLLVAGGLASIHFTSQTSEQELRRLMRGFAAIGPKADAAGEILKQALAGGDGSIKLNAVRYVTEDAALGDAAMTARLTAKAIGGGPAELRDALDNPQLLLQLIAAAQGANAPGLPLGSGTGAAAPAASGVQSAATGSGTGSTAAATPSENETLQMIRTIAGIARAGRPPADGSAAAETPLPQQLAELPATSQELFQQALAGLATMAPAAKPDAPMLVQLAEHLAIRFALERFDRGEVRVNSIRETLERASQEIATLRKILTGHEQALAKAGVASESHADILDRQFWARVPESGKRAALLSPEAWCIPPRNASQYLEELLKKNEKDTAAAILLNYASCVGHADADARSKTARGLTELAGLCARFEPKVLDSAIRCVGEQLTWEEDKEIQELLAAAYAKLAQEASAQKNLGSILTALSWLEHASREKKELETLLRPRLGVSDRLPDFVEQAMKDKGVPAGLDVLFRKSVKPVAELLAARFGRCSRREECERVVELFDLTGAEGVTHLREVLRTGEPGQAAATVGLLSRTSAAQLERLLIPRLSGWNRAHHDAVVQQLAYGAAPERGRLLARLFPVFDHLVLAQALDEISLSGDPAAAQLLLRLAAGEVPQAADPFLRAKAVEGLGRLREKRAIPLLQDVASAKQMWRWVHPDEMRVVALQAMSKLDPEWARSFAPQSGLKATDLAIAPLDPAEEAPWARQRRYARVSLPRSVSLLAKTGKGEISLESSLLSLGGGVTSAADALAPGTPGTVQIKSGWRNVNAEVLFREAPRAMSAFEIVEMDLEDRARLRRLLAGQAA